MSSRGGKSRKMRPEYHLIVTEGTETEPAYFEAIKTAINNIYKERIQLTISGEGENTLSLLETARKRAAENPNGYSHVWIVFDTDDFPAENVDAVVCRCEELSSDEMKYHAIWSNQCFELWFLLHFSYFHADLHRAEYFPKLSENLKRLGKGAYQKNRPDMYSVLRPYIPKAIDHAKKLADENKGKNASDSCPGTKVYELIEKLLPYLPE